VVKFHNHGVFQAVTGISA